MHIRRGALRNLVKGTNLRAHEFDLTQETSDEGVHTTRIVFLPDPELGFEISSRGDNEECFVRMAPGLVAETETKTVTESQPNKGDVHGRVSSELQQWLRRIDEDLQARALHRYRETAKAAFDEILEGIEDGDEYFTREEAGELKEKLDALQEQMDELIREHAPDKATANSKMAEIHSDIEYLRERTDKVNKGAWFRSAATVAAAWLGDPDNRAMLGTATAAVRQLLLPAP